MSDEGLFGPGSVTWRVNREGVLLLGGGCALILQVAHPLVAAGVAEHSNYREDPWGRLYRTLDLTTKIVFGSSKTAKEASDRIKEVHGRVKGVTKESGGRYPAGTLHPDLPVVMRPVVEAVNVATTGFLPERLRQELDLPWGPNRERLMGASRVVLSALLPVLPRVMREFPPARSAERRVRKMATA